MITDEDRMRIELDCIVMGDYDSADYLVRYIDHGFLAYQALDDGYVFRLTPQGVFTALEDQEFDGELMRGLFLAQVAVTLNALGRKSWLKTIS